MSPFSIWHGMGKAKILKTLHFATVPAETRVAETRILGPTN